MAWTDMTRLLLKDPLDVTYWNAVKNNLDHVKDTYLAGHSANGHFTDIDSGGNREGNYPVAVFFVEWDGSLTYTVTNNQGLTNVTATRDPVGAGTLVKVTIDWSHASCAISGTFASVDDYAALVAPITSLNEFGDLVSYTAAVQNYDPDAVRVFINQWDGATSDGEVPKDASFVLVLAGKTTATGWDDETTITASWTHLPDLVDGMPIPTEWFDGLRSNLFYIESIYPNKHNSYDGGHEQIANIPVQAGVLTYKTSIDQNDRREFVVEPWTHGVRDGMFRAFDRTSPDGSQTAKLAEVKLGLPYDDPLEYGVLVTPNAYTYAAARQRMSHPMQYRDAFLIPFRYWDGTDLSWEDVDENGSGAPDSVAFCRWQKTSPTQAYAAGSRLANYWSQSAPAEDDQISLLWASMWKEELDELWRMFQRHHKADGTHDLPPPGTYGFGRVTVSGSTYTLQSWSRGVSGVATRTSGVDSSPADGCRLTFDSTFTSFRNWGLLVSPETNTVASARTVVVERSSGAQADVFCLDQAGSGTPAEVRCDFNYLLIGQR